MATLTFRTSIQKILFTQELSGQISDGMWENARPFNHWEAWCDCDVVVGDNVGRDFRVEKDNYSLNNKELLEIIGERMIGMVKMHLSFPNMPAEICESLGDYSIKTLKDYSKGGTDKYWTSKLEECLKYATEEEVERALASDVYGMKKMKEDLKEMKKAMKVRV